MFTVGKSKWNTYLYIEPGEFYQFWNTGVITMTP